MSEAEKGNGWSSDRNLLYCIVALRVGFISAEQLIASMHAWIDTKSESIAEVLVRLGFLTEVDCAALKPLVFAFIAKHGGSTKGSLAAIRPQKEFLNQLNKLRDPDVSASLANLDNSEATELDATVSLFQQLPRYQVQSFHAEGGLGKVSIARDNELGRQVAFKEILDKYAGEPIARQRFLAEAEITGRLEHPGIVPVYGLGKFPDGRPFYAMRFIRGDSLRRAIKVHHSDGSKSNQEMRSEFRNLLERLLHICDAISYAHSRGILHRDLKPGNVMLGPHGETLVVDWGLAKPIGRESESDSHDSLLVPNLTSGSVSTVGSAIGSPAYMSPEQANGELDALGPATDVFGLGAILYSILTGTAPYESESRNELLELAKECRIQPPLEVNERTPQALSEICMKALSRAPVDRYQTAKEFREEIWNWLSNEPLSALRAAVRHFESLVAEHPSVTQYQTRLALENFNLSRVYQSLDRLHEAKSRAEIAVALLEAVESQGGQDFRIVADLSVARGQLVSCLRTLGEEEAAGVLEKRQNEAMQSQMQRLANQGDRKSALEFSLHQGFSLEEAERLLSEFTDDRDKGEITTEYVASIDGDDENLNGSFFEADSPQAKAHSDNYTLHEVLGRGGLGVVYRATHNFLLREVALKTIQIKSAEAAKIAAREAAILSLLDHPNIVDLYHAGVSPGANGAYIALRLINGRSWRDIAIERREQRFVPRERYSRGLLMGFAEICDAIHHTHCRGIVHCDPNPSNVIVDESGKAWLIDWSLGFVESQSFLRATADHLKHLDPIVAEFLLEPAKEGAIVGTPVYMAPEQWAGRAGYSSDIYILGTCLYMLLTGEPPFGPKNAVAIRELKALAQEGSFARPRELKSSIPRRLERICLRAMETDVHNRYPSAQELGADVRRFLGLRV